MTLHRAAALAAIIIFVAAHAGRAHEYQLGNLKIDHPWSRTTPQVAKTGAGYMTIRNEGSSADRLIGISSPAAEAVEIHQSIMDGTIMRMRPVPDGLKIGARQSVKLEPGGYHLMLMQLRAPFRQGERVPVLLRFEKGGEITVELEIEAPGGGGQHHGHNQGR